MIESYKDSRIRFFSINNNGVIGYSRNFGVEKSNGRYLAFLDSMIGGKKKNFLYVLVSCKKQDKDICYHNCYLISNFNKKKTRCENYFQITFSI